MRRLTTQSNASSGDTMNGKNPNTDYDILIVGGGMVGSALACALGDTHYRVAVLETRLPAELEAGAEPDQRVSAITRASQNLFETIGAWQGMVARRVSPYHHMTVWDATGDGEIDFDAGDVGELTLGHIIENRVIQLALLERIADFDNLTLLAPASLEELEWQDERVTAQVSMGGETRQISTRLVVAADGARSRVRDMAGIAFEGWDYQQSGVVCWVQSEKSHEATCWQRFQPTGPVAFLPLSDGRCSIVWSTTPEEAERLLGLDDEHFRLELADALGGRLGAMVDSGPRAAFPLRRRNAESYVAPRLALVGDAAHNIHPLAGQGVNLGLMDIGCLAQVLIEAGRQRDPGELTILRRHERWRKAETLLMMTAMDGLKRLFGTDLGPVSRLRNLGLALTNSVQPVKRELTRRAMGLEGDLPDLAKGRDPRARGPERRK